jgi:hypothetical protein
MYNTTSGSDMERMAPVLAETRTRIVVYTPYKDLKTVRRVEGEEFGDPNHGTLELVHT